MDNHPFLFTPGATNTSSCFFDEEDTFGYVHYDPTPWFPANHRPEDAVSLADHPPLNHEAFSRDHSGAEPKSIFTEPSSVGRSTTATNLARGATPWSTYDTRMHRAYLNVADMQLSADLEGLPSRSPSHWPANKESATFSDDDCSLQTSGYGENMSDLRHTTAPSSATQGTHISYLPSSTQTYTEFTIDGEDSYYRNDLVEPFVEASRHDPCESHGPDTEYPSIPKEKRYMCENCRRFFMRQPDLSRHRKTMHGGSQGYRCAVEGCSKAGKIWARMDSFKQHLSNRHRGTDVQRPVKRSSRSFHVADDDLLFSVTTPALMQRKRLEG
ncbi:hypothetical protein FB567DRAFT_549392 [Paraphoma chrysanthemicola]|uniref:C2H2-type domain-containing protein n=1 Tax=Paraphoma chrysanthemicola TaxID=798071 RepID=A0A8K0VY99_9PLEO|nr:hypothetical protein FB567DRAFT_549392 [Paraphoma chrysanthemicola]